MNRLEYQKAMLVLQAACAAYARRLAQHVVENGDEIAEAAIGGESSYCTEQLVELTDRLREHTMALAGLNDWEHIWAPQTLIVVTAAPTGVVQEETRE